MPVSETIAALTFFILSYERGHISYRIAGAMIIVLRFLHNDQNISFIQSPASCARRTPVRRIHRESRDRLTRVVSRLRYCTAICAREATRLKGEDETTPAQKMRVNAVSHYSTRRSTTTTASRQQKHQQQLT